MNGACPHEENVMHAATEGAWTESLRAHVVGCADCAAAAEAAPFMRDFAAIDEREHILPDPAVVWLKAQLMRSSAMAERAARPMNVFQMAAYLVVAAGWAALLTWKWGALQAWMFSLSPSHYIQAGSGGAVLSVNFFVLVIGLASVTAMLAVHTILAED